MVACKSEQVMTLNNAETKIFLQTRLRNLKRKNAKLSQYPEFAEQYLENLTEIQDIEDQLKLI